MPTLTIEAAVRRARLMAGCFVAYVALLPFVLEKFVPTGAATVAPTVFVAICIVCVAEIGVAFVIRKRSPLVREAIASSEGAPPAVRKWLTIQIASYAIATSVALYGIALRVLGASFAETVPFYAAALVLLLGWWPRQS